MRDLRCLSPRPQADSESGLKAMSDWCCGLVSFALRHSWSAAAARCFGHESVLAMFWAERDEVGMALRSHVCIVVVVMQEGPPSWPEKGSVMRGVRHFVVTWWWSRDSRGRSAWVSVHLFALGGDFGVMDIVGVLSGKIIRNLIDSWVKISGFDTVDFTGLERGMGVVQKVWDQCITISWWHFVCSLTCRRRILWSLVQRKEDEEKNKRVQQWNCDANLQCN